MHTLARKRYSTIIGSISALQMSFNSNCRFLMLTRKAKQHAVPLRPLFDSPIRMMMMMMMMI